MPDSTTSVIEARRAGSRTLYIGIAAIALILAIAAGGLFWSLPDADAFNTRVERIFVENDNLTSDAEIKLLEILAASGTSFAEVLQSYRQIIFVLLVFAVAMLATALALLGIIAALNRRMEEVERQGIQVNELIISREERLVLINNMEFKLTEAAIETLSVLAEARMDEEILSGAQLEATIQGRRPEDCEEAAGATRIKRLRDSLGNQIVSELLVRNIARKGYVLTIPRDAIRMV
ncbi:winged helix-turn-helix domain-containing protein [Tropicimonas sp.]|uniref:winged helix-turn-helix domain-containing protein n=1 Tax=Tropicimonas sp. TaxID=2067044 RepID=UPI003A86FE94